jgi:nucleotidyltransferase substrate binding protein (TIGR01987 family)
MGDPVAPLDIGPFVRVIARLTEGLDGHHKEPDDEQLRDGLIQRFEFTYELSHRMLRRYLDGCGIARYARPDAIPGPNLIRTGNEQGLLRGDWPAWRRYREMRARTSHAYAAAIAAQVAAGIPAFLDEATYFRDQLEQRLR